MTVALLLLILLKMKNQLIIMSKLFDLNTTNLSHLSFLQKKKKNYLTIQVSNKNLRTCESEIWWNKSTLTCWKESWNRVAPLVGKIAQGKLQWRGISYFFWIYVILLLDIYIYIYCEFWKFNYWILCCLYS